MHAVQIVLSSTSSSSAEILAICRKTRGTVVNTRRISVFPVPAADKCSWLTRRLRVCLSRIWQSADDDTQRSVVVRPKWLNAWSLVRHSRRRRRPLIAHNCGCGGWRWRRQWTMTDVRVNW